MLHDINTNADIHLRNILKILMFTIEKKETNRKELVQNLNISSGTISNVCNLLITKKFCKELKISNSLRGPNVKKFILTNDNYYIGVLDLFNTDKAKFIILQLNMSIVQSFEFYIGNNLKSFIESFKNCFNSIDSIKKKKIIGIGVPIAGTMFHKKQTIVSSLIPFFEGIKLPIILKNIIKLPVLIENESDICAVSCFIREQFIKSHCIYIFADEGVGIGVLYNQNLLKGENGLDSDICNLISPYSIKNKTIEQVLSKKSKASMSIKGKTLGYLISVLINLFDINNFFIGGNLSYQFKEIQTYMYQIIDELVLQRSLRKIRIIQDTKFENTLLYGSHIMILQHLITTYKFLEI